MKIQRFLTIFFLILALSGLFFLFRSYSIYRKNLSQGNEVDVTPQTEWAKNLQVKLHDPETGQDRFFLRAKIYQSQSPNVVLLQGVYLKIYRENESFTIQAETGEWWKKKGLVRFRKNVVFETQDGFELKTDLGIYRERSGIFRTPGPFTWTWEEKSLHGQGNRGVYKEREKILRASGNVRIAREIPFQKWELKGHHLLWNRSDQLARVWDQSQLVFTARDREAHVVCARFIWQFHSKFGELYRGFPQCHGNLRIQKKNVSFNGRELFGIPEKGQWKWVLLIGTIDVEPSWKIYGNRIVFQEEKNGIGLWGEVPFHVMNREWKKKQILTRHLLLQDTPKEIMFFPEGLVFQAEQGKIIGSSGMFFKDVFTISDDVKGQFQGLQISAQKVMIGENRSTWEGDAQHPVVITQSGKQKEHGRGEALTIKAQTCMMTDEKVVCETPEVGMGEQMIVHADRLKSTEGNQRSWELEKVTQGVYHIDRADRHVVLFQTELLRKKDGTSCMTLKGKVVMTIIRAQADVVQIKGEHAKICQHVLIVDDAPVVMYRNLTVRASYLKSNFDTSIVRMSGNVRVLDKEKNTLEGQVLVLDTEKNEVLLESSGYQRGKLIWKVEKD